MKRKVKRLVRTVLFMLHQRKHEKFYHDVMHRNGIKDEWVEGEKEWLVRYSQFGGKAKPSQYRVFCHYMGKSMDIVPEDICHDYIEPLLNPFTFTGYYSDKNVFDKLFPEGYMPRTILRKMNGFFYSDKYELLHLDKTILGNILMGAGCPRLIVKPSVNGMSGVGVNMFEKSHGGGILMSLTGRN